MRLQGKSAVITGAARGIRLEFARANIAEGATVTLADINLPPVTEAATSHGSCAHGVQVAADLTGMAVFLATDEADYICAQTFGVDGGNWVA